MHRKTEATKTTFSYESGILGKNDIITSMRQSKQPPSDAEMMERLIEWNFMKRDEFMSNTVIVLETVVTRREFAVFTKPMSMVAERTNDRRNGVTIRPRGESPNGDGVAS